MPDTRAAYRNLWGLPQDPFRSLAPPFPYRADTETTPPVRYFEGDPTTPRIELTPGGVASIGGGDTTVAVCLQVANYGGVGIGGSPFWLGVDGTTTPRIAIEISPFNNGQFILHIDGVFKTGHTGNMGLGWLVIAFTRPAGATSTVRAHRYTFATRVWSHFNMSGTAADAVNTGSALLLGRFGDTGSDFMDGYLAAAAAWDRVLDDTEIETLDTTLQDWYDSTPVGLWRPSDDPADDLIGTSDQVAITGTRIVRHTAPEPFDFELAAGGTIFPVSLDGAITPAGVLADEVRKTLAASSTPTGALAKQTQKLPAGTVTPAAILLKQIARVYTGTSTPTGALANIRIRLAAFAGLITPTSTLTRQTNKPVGGASTPTGVLTRQPQKKTLAGTVTPTSVLGNVRTKLVAFAGAITPGGILTKQTGKPLGGTVTPTGSLTRQTQKRPGGTITPTSTLANIRTRLVSFAGSITPTSLLTRQPRRILTGQVTPTSTVTKQTARRFTAASTPTGTLTRSAIRPKALAGQTTPTGLLRRQVAKTLTGSSSPTSTLLKLISRILGGTTEPVGALATQHIGQAGTPDEWPVHFEHREPRPPTFRESGPPTFTERRRHTRYREGQG